MVAATVEVPSELPSFLGDEAGAPSPAGAREGTPPLEKFEPSNPLAFTPLRRDPQMNPNPVGGKRSRREVEKAAILADLAAQAGGAGPAAREPGSAPAAASGAPLSRKDAMLADIEAFKVENPRGAVDRRDEAAGKAGLRRAVGVLGTVLSYNFLVIVGFFLWFLAGCLGKFAFETDVVIDAFTGGGEGGSSLGGSCRRSRRTWAPCRFSAPGASGGRLFLAALLRSAAYPHRSCPRAPHSPELRP